MENNSVLQKNLELWARAFPKEALLMPYIETDGFSFCKTENDELNLACNIEGHSNTFHDDKNAKEEAKQWFATLDQSHVGALYVYGIGLGYYYLAAKEWLHADAKRTLIFLEDDLAVLRKFFELDCATELLSDPQVHIIYFKDPLHTSEPLDEVYWHVALDKALVSVLKFYEKTRKETYNKLLYEIAYGSELKKALIEEYLDFGAPFFANFYENLLHLPDSYKGNKLFGKFQNVPAIICGAGPSLEKNMGLLKALSNRAIIFAGGSAINILNTASIQPHLCVAIDPNEAQNVRLYNTQAYEVPFFYRNRLNPNALNTIHGPHLYLTGSGGYDVADYFDAEFGLSEDENEIDEGHNVVTFALEIAQKMGCNPIIFMGMDLAFTDRKTYSSGVVFDPAIEQKTLDIYANFETTGLLHRDIYGQPIYTLWKWVSESEWIAEWAKKHPEITLFNCTEGGIGFSTIENCALKTVAEKYLQESYDITGKIHAEIQAAGLTGVAQKQVIGAVNQLKDSLKICTEHLEVLMTELEVQNEKMRLNEKSAPQSGLAALAEIELADEVGCMAILNIFNQVYSKLLNSQLQQIVHSPLTEQEKQLGRSELNSHRLKFLYTVAKVNCELIDFAFERYAERQKENEAVKTQTIEPFLLKDTPQESQLSWKLSGSKVVEDYYPTGGLKSIYHLKNGLLDGPSVFYSEEGGILAKTFFSKGLQEGESLWYFNSGNLYSKQNYLKGLKDGLQVFYFADGSVKTELHYKNGQLTDCANLYNEKGVLKRTVTFA